MFHLEAVLSRETQTYVCCGLCPEKVCSKGLYGVGLSTDVVLSRGFVYRSYVQKIFSRRRLEGVLIWSMSRKGYIKVCLDTNDYTFSLTMSTPPAG